MSFSMTTPQMRDRTKTVTRRLGWKFLKKGDLVRAVEKSQGLRKGEKIRPIGVIEIVRVDEVQVRECSDTDAAREGYPDLSGDAFVAMFCRKMGAAPWDEITRIEFRHRPDLGVGR